MMRGMQGKQGRRGMRRSFGCDGILWDIPIDGTVGRFLAFSRDISTGGNLALIGHASDTQ